MKIFVLILIYIAISTFFSRYNKMEKKANKKDLIKKEKQAIKTKQRDEIHNSVASQIEEVLPKFNHSNFIKYSKDLFLDLQKAISYKDFPILKQLLSEELYKSCSDELCDLTAKHEKEIIRDITFYSIRYHDFHKYTDFYVYDILINCDMVSYIINEKNNVLISGSDIPNNYTFILSLRKDFNSTGCKIVNLKRS